MSQPNQTGQCIPREYAEREIAKAMANVPYPQTSGFLQQVPLPVLPKPNAGNTAERLKSTHNLISELVTEINLLRTAISTGLYPDLSEGLAGNNVSTPPRPTMSQLEAEIQDCNDLLFRLISEVRDTKERVRL